MPQAAQEREARNDTVAAAVSRSEKLSIQLAANVHTNGEVSALLRRFCIDDAVAEGQRLRDQLAQMKGAGA